MPGPTAKTSPSLRQGFGQGLHGATAVIVVKMIIQIQNFRGAMSQPGQGLTLGYLMIGAKAGEVMAK